ncbi:MAG: hypothetical protein INH41_26525 [Myxococcaceae bacterium]|jgi:hypothetical protein|nr:hypothetical protein [Myxococcaceae bacterium]MCA3015955.1 hypothetical protein [Myxococcaceae bacterium]
MFMLTLVVVLALSIFGLRALRRRGLLATRSGRCEGCGSHAPLARLNLFKNTGMLVLRQTSSFEGALCRRCALRKAGAMTLHTAVLGWWGTISFVLTVLILPANLLQAWWAAGLPGAPEAAREALEAHLDYARNLLETKDRATVVDVLARTTGAAPVDVERFLARRA